MNEKMPRTPFSTPLSGSVKETEMRIRNIMSGPKKRPPLPFLILVFSVCIFCGNLVSCQVAEEDGGPEGPPAAEVWLDFRDGSGEDMPWNDSIETGLPEYPGVTFRWTADRVCAVEDGNETVLFSGMPVWSVFLCDLNGDGLRELCSVTSFGSGIVDDRIIAYDFFAKKTYMLQSRWMFDYGLALEGGQLRVSRFRYTDGRKLSEGRLAVDADTILLEGEERYHALRMVDETPLPSDEPDLSWLLMREHENYPYSAETMFSQLLLSQEGEDCTLGLALVSSRQHPAGLGNLMLGLWDKEAQEWRGPVYEVGGDDGQFSSWTAPDGALHILCANTAIYQGDEGAFTAAHYRFDGKTLEELDRREYEERVVPVEGGLEVYEIDPQYRLQLYNPEYNEVPLPEKWRYSHFEPIAD